MLRERRLNYNIGTEGPLHDPYGYVEWTVTINGNNITIHLGLDEFVKFNEERVASGLEDSKYVFFAYTGIPLESLDRIYNRMKYRCTECGNKKGFHPIDGHPGETLIACSQYLHVVDSEIDLSAIR